LRLWLFNRWESLRESLWFLPAIMVATAIALSYAVIPIDRAARTEDWLTTGWTYSRGPEGSRAVLSVVAGSMVTIASVTFSITVVALQLASSQFGPRLLRNFMRDRGNQVAMGTFIATFTYCLLVLRTVNGVEEQVFVPHLAVTLGLVLSLASLGVLIYFIHHAAESIQAENVIAAVSHDLDVAMDRLYPEQTGEAHEDAHSAKEPSLPEKFHADERTVRSPRSDYLQAIDIDRLMSIATKGDLVISIRTRPGKFVTAGCDLFAIWPSDRIDDEVQEQVLGAFFFGHRRTLIQDVEFAIDQLVEIAVRALSPGVNDPFTAINCVDRLGAALCRLAHRKFPSRCRVDDDGRLRMITDRSTPAGIVNASFNQIRQAARTDTAVTIRLLEAILAIAQQTSNPDFTSALRRQAELIRQGSETGLPVEADRIDVNNRFQAVTHVLENRRRNARSASS
jgi:uncharacterized membrane protein